MEIEEFVQLDKSNAKTLAFEEMINKLKSLGFYIFFETGSSFNDVNELCEDETVFIRQDDDMEYRLWIKNPEFEKIKTEEFLKWYDDNNCGEKAEREFEMKNGET